MTIQAIRDALSANPDAGYPAVTAEALRAALEEAEALSAAVRDWFASEKMMSSMHVHDYIRDVVTPRVEHMRACLSNPTDALRERDARVREAALSEAEEAAGDAMWTMPVCVPAAEDARHVLNAIRALKSEQD